MKTVKLVVYGTLMTGEGNHRLCANAVNITPCTIVGTLYDTGWGFPAFEQTGDTVVHAELIEIPFEDWSRVDGLEGYPRLYDRKLIQSPDWMTFALAGSLFMMYTQPVSVLPSASVAWMSFRS